MEFGLNGIFLGLNGIDFLGFMGCSIFGYILIRIDVRILRISRIRTDFFIFLPKTKHLGSKKSVPIREICKIRTSIRIKMYPKMEHPINPKKINPI
ncbi:MAG: hypothetical protein RLZZ628_3681 [Bacteroidota bacterium]